MYDPNVLLDTCDFKKVEKKLIMRNTRAFLSRIKSRIYLKVHEKNFNGKEGVRLKYLFIKHTTSKDLLIVFSGMNPNKAVYNYVTTLKKIPANKVFILDDAGADERGCYYIGTNGKKEIEAAILDLIEFLTIKNKIDKYVCIGTSRGGYAALNFGLFLNADIIVGAPQYYLGSYLKHPKLNQMLKTILGNQYTEEDLKGLDNRLFEKIYKLQKMYNGKIYMHFSTEEHTYKEHIEGLINDLIRLNYTLFLDKATYENHDDVAKFFPDYLLRTLNYK